MLNTGILICLLGIITLVKPVGSAQWPAPYKRYDKRPPSDPFCEAKFAFCPTGETTPRIPVMQDNDILEVYVMKKPVFQFVLGDLMGKFDIMHDALGFRNLRTGLNFTMEWYELFELANCTFPHVLENDQMIWCNQGALCTYNGINDTLWTEYGSITLVTKVTGDKFNKFADWLLWDNNTGLFYETWFVSNPADGQLWFEAWDCAEFVIRSMNKLHDLGVTFDSSTKINYTRIHLYSDEPVLLGNHTSLFGPGGNKTIAAEITDFYKLVQPHLSTMETIEHVIEFIYGVVSQHKFFLFYNQDYYWLPMKSPYMKLSYDPVSLPGYQQSQVKLGV